MSTSTPIIRWQNRHDFVVKYLSFAENTSWIAMFVAQIRSDA
jgi:hypothetical protein